MKKPYINTNNRRVKTVYLPLATIFIAFFVSSVMSALRPEQEKVNDQGAPMLVEAMLVSKERVNVSIAAQGRVQPKIQTTLISEVSGRVIETSQAFVAGSLFKKGDVLLKLDDGNYRAALKQAKAAMANAETLYLQEQAKATVQQREWKRGGKKKMDEAGLALYLRKPQLAEAKAQLEFAKEEVSRAQRELDKTWVRAPYDGMLKDKFIDVGQFVSSGTQLAETFSTDYAEVRLALAPQNAFYLVMPTLADVEAAQAQVGAPAKPIDTGASGMEYESALADGEPVIKAASKIALPQVMLSSKVGNGSIEWQAELVRTEGMLDDNSHALYVVAQVKDPYRLLPQHRGLPPLMAGTFVEAAIEGREYNDVVVLPRHILKSDNVVWIIDDNDTLRRREVTVLDVGGDQAYVIAGLEAGERVCITHVGNVIPGTQVRVSDEVDTLAYGANND